MFTFVNAKDVNAAAAKTFNSILRERMEKADEIIAREFWRRDKWWGFKRYLFGRIYAPILNWENRKILWKNRKAQLLKNDRRITSIYPAQARMARSLFALSEGVLRRGGKVMPLALEEMANIEIGWAMMLDEEAAKDKGRKPPYPLP